MTDANNEWLHLLKYSSMSEENKYWLNGAANAIIESHPEGEIIVSSGVSPSGPYHVGHLREVLTADALTYSLKRAGREARHLHFVDDFDGLRKVPLGVPAEYEDYIGMPYYLVPSPDGSGSFADKFFNDFKSVTDEMLVDMEVVRSFEQYQSGMFTDAIEKTLENVDSIKGMIERISHRQLARDWSPVQILGPDNKLTKWKYVSLDKDKKTLVYEKEDGSTDEIPYNDGKVKLDWRLDWPARWSIWGVDVEPFGRDHATKGGSYDTGKELVQKVFSSSAPKPFPYEFINRKGETKKMSASSGDVITPADAAELMPPELLRYFVLKGRPGLTLFFDTGVGYGRLFDEFKLLKPTKDLDARDTATRGNDAPVLSDIPFVHLLTAWQSAHGDTQKTKEIIQRSEHGERVEEQSDLIDKELRYIKAWLNSWAPEEVKFSIQDKLPDVVLNERQRLALAKLASKISSAPEDADGQWFHETVYAVKDEAEIEPKELFQAIYRVLLGKDSGPKAGWFLSIQDREFLINRFNLKS